MKIRQSLLESIAIGASFACLIHCLALPLLLAALPAASQLLDIPESFHLVMLAVALPISAFALMNGYSRSFAEYAAYHTAPNAVARNPEIVASINVEHAARPLPALLRKTDAWTNLTPIKFDVAEDEAFRAVLGYLTQRPAASQGTQRNDQ